MITRRTPGNPRSVKPEGAAAQGRAFLRGALWAGVVAGAGAWVGVSADSSAWSARVLQLEPLLMVVAVWGVYAAFVRGWSAFAWGSVVGLTLALGAVHRPVRPLPPGEPPLWAEDVLDCARGLRPPSDPVRVLLWTLEDVRDPAEVLSVVQNAEADVTILHGTLGRGLGPAIVSGLGGSFVVKEAEGAGDGRLIHTRGVFHACGEASNWSEAVDGPYGVTLLFAGVAEGTTIPLVVGRLPALDAPLLDWGAEAERARARLSGMVDILGARSTVVVADAGATGAYRWLDGAMGGAGVRSLAVVPSGPVRVGRLPGVAVHAWDRVWAGGAWSLRGSERIPTAQGVRAPILVELVPVR